MGIARRLLVPEGISRSYHCLSRCVRKAYLCGDRRAHRKDWIKRRLLELDRVFAIEVGAFAIMGNHLHLMVRTQPQWVDTWSDEEIARRWLRLFPRVAEKLRQASGAMSERKIIQQIADDRARIGTWRKRLASLSWFMKCLKEPIARRANREDGVTGHFWEGRFKVQVLLDEAAVVACLAYIDLNPVRAGVASTPERSDHTSIRDRVRVRQWSRGARRARRSESARHIADIVRLPEGRVPAHAEDGIWLIPIARRRGQTAARRCGLSDLTLDEYLTLVDRTGRQVQPGRRGRIAGCAPILSRLDVRTECWLEQMLGNGRKIGTAIGNAASLAAEAARRGTKWVVNPCPLHGPS
ncbi:MAG: transposase [Planctomycetota bacterium]|jgi:REP element-mobilizing transposase RayT